MKNNNENLKDHCALKKISVKWFNASSSAIMNDIPTRNGT